MEYVLFYSWSGGKKNTGKLRRRRRIQTTCYRAAHSYNVYTNPFSHEPTLVVSTTTQWPQLFQIITNAATDRSSALTQLTPPHILPGRSSVFIASNQSSDMSCLVPWICVHSKMGLGLAAFLTTYVIYMHLHHKAVSKRRKLYSSKTTILDYESQFFLTKEAILYMWWGKCQPDLNMCRLYHS